MEGIPIIGWALAVKILENHGWIRGICDEFVHQEKQARIHGIELSCHVGQCIYGSDVVDFFRKRELYPEMESAQALINAQMKETIGWIP